MLVHSSPARPQRRSEAVRSHLVPSYGRGVQVGQGWRPERVRVAERVRQLLSGTVFEGGAEEGAPAAAARWLPNRRAAVAMALAVVVTVILTGWWFLSSRPQPIAVTTSDGPGATAAARGAATRTPAATPASSTGPAASRSPDVLVVEVAGKVRTPGIYRLPGGSRVYQAVRAAGGALPGTDTTGINMAAPISDGEQIIVGGPPGSGGTVIPPPPGGVPGAAGGSSAPVPLNSATQEQLESLPGVGPVLAQKILDWRNEHGRFTSVDELRQVSGIGEVKFAALKPRVTV